MSVEAVMITALIKKDVVWKNELFSKSSYLWNKIGVELDLPNHSTKSYVKDPTNFDTSQFAEKDNSANLKSDIDELEIDELKKYQLECFKQFEK